MAGVLKSSWLAMLQRNNQTTGSIMTNKDSNVCAKAVREDHLSICKKGNSGVLKDSSDERRLLEAGRETDMATKVVGPKTTTKRATCAMIQILDTEDQLLDEEQSDCDSEYVDHDNNSEQEEGEEFCDVNGGACLPPELIELAQILESNWKTRIKWDWDIIDREASPNLKALINRKRSNSSLHSNPMRIVVGMSTTPLFQAYLQQLREGRKGEATYGVIREQSGQILTCDSAASTQAQASEFAYVAPLDESRRPKAACSDVLDSEPDHVFGYDDLVPDNKPPPRLVVSSVKKPVVYDGNIPLDNNFGLPSELLELARILASQPNHGKGVRWDWNHVLNNASATLLEFISIRKSKGGLSCRSVVGEVLLPCFTAYHLRLRRKRQCSDGQSSCKEEPEMKQIRRITTKEFVSVGKFQTREARLATKCKTVPTEKAKKARLASNTEPVPVQSRTTEQTRLACNGISVPTEEARHAGLPIKGRTFSSKSCMAKQSRSVYNGIGFPTDNSNNLNRLNSELQELAGILAKAKGCSWAYIESQASPGLKSYISCKARADPSYISTPMISLVPSDCLEAFDALVKERSIERNQNQDEDFPAVANDVEETNERGNTKHRKLGQMFAMERKSSILKMTANLRAELAAFEEQEVTLWDSFLQG
jgi:hypothetical protein